MADRVLCTNCGADLTAFHDEAGPRLPCPTCGDTRRAFEASAAVSARGTAVVSSRAAGVSGPITGVLPALTVEAAGVVEVQKQLAAHFEHLVRTYPPAEPGDKYVLELVNPDTGLVDLVVDDDRAEGFRRLAPPFADDT